MFGSGVTQIQPVYVEDVAEAVALALQQPTKTFECGGPHVCTYAGFLRSVAHEGDLIFVLENLTFRRSATQTIALDRHVANYLLNLLSTDERRRHPVR